MAKASIHIISVLRKTAEKIQHSSDYQWGHMGACNCGFLAQEITKLRKEEIHQRAMEGHGDWTEQLNDYCPTSGLPMDNLIANMIAFGFDTDDLKNLERLTDKRVLLTLPPEGRSLQHNNKADVVKYIRAWAEVLEDDLLSEITLPNFNQPQTIL